MLTRVTRIAGDVSRRAAVKLTTALPVPGWLLLAAAFLLACWATIVTRTQWGPDSRLYLAWTYWYFGYSQPDAAQVAYDTLYAMDGVTPCGFCWQGNYRYDFFHGAYGAVVGPRVVFPLLSVPFVALFGPWGMTVVPFLLYGLAIVAMVVLASRLFGQRWAFATGALMILPVVVSRWAVHTMTEAPALFFTAAVLLFLPLARRTTRRDLVWFIVLLELGLFTRQFAMVIPAGVALAWLVVALRDRRVRNAWFGFAVGGVVATGVTLLVQGAMARALGQGASYSYVYHFMHHARYGGFGDRPRIALPRIVRNIVSDDFDYMRIDIVLMAVLLVALVSVLWRFRSEISGLTVGMFAATYALNIIIVWPTAFRYSVPQWPVYVLACVALLADLFGPRRRRPSRSTEAAPGSPWHGLPERAIAPSPAAEEVPPPEVGRPGAFARAVATLRRAQPRSGFALLTGLFVLVTMLLTNRERQWLDSSVYTLAWVYRLLGGSPAGALADADAALPWLPPPDGLTSAAAMAEPRLFGAVIFAPFVAAFGPGGILVVALLAFAVATVMVVVLGARLGGTMVGFLAGVALLMSAPVSRFAVAADTGALVVAAAVACLLVLPLGRAATRRDTVWFAVLLAAALLLSHRSLAVAAGVVVAWLATAVRERSARNGWLPAAVVSAALGVVVPLIALAVSGLGARFAHPLPSGIWTYLVKLVAGDFRALAPDRTLYTVLFLLPFAAILLWRRWPALVGLVAGGLATGAVLQLLGGPRGSFADYLAAYPAAVVAAALAVQRIVAGWREAPNAREERAEVDRDGEPAHTTDRADAAYV